MGGSCREVKLDQHLWEEPGKGFGAMDDQEEDWKPARSLSVLQRLDRLDRLMQTLEESHGLSARQPNNFAVKKFEPRDECKSISLALEEVHHKGTLVERVAMLENRLLQLRLEIDAANTSKSSCSSALSTEKTGNNELESNAPARGEDHEDAATIPWENKNPSPVKALKARRVPKLKGRREGKTSLLTSREWFGCFQS